MVSRFKNVKNQKKIFNTKFRTNLKYDNKTYSNVFYLTTSPTFFFNKTRRLIVARSKRTIKKKKTVSSFWVKLGKLVFFFKKSLNSRMGKGNGSFYSIRRWVTGGTCLFWYLTKRSGLSHFAFNYMLARFFASIKRYIIFSKFNFILSGLQSSWEKSKKKTWNRRRRFLKKYSINFSKRQKFFFRLTFKFWRKLFYKKFFKKKNLKKIDFFFFRKLRRKSFIAKFFKKNSIKSLTIYPYFINTVYSDFFDIKWIVFLA